MNKSRIDSIKRRCRTCLARLASHPINDNTSVNILHVLTGGTYSTYDELPQQICDKCLEHMRIIKSFLSQCQKSDSYYEQCVNHLNNDEDSLKEETISSIETDNNTTENNQNKLNLEQIVEKDEKKVEEPVVPGTSGISCKKNIKPLDAEEKTLNEKSNEKRKYRCNLCPKEFSQKCRLLKHKKKSHRD